MTESDVVKILVDHAIKRGATKEEAMNDPVVAFYTGSLRQIEAMVKDMRRMSLRNHKSIINLLIQLLTEKAISWAKNGKGVIVDEQKKEGQEAGAKAEAKEESPGTQGVGSGRG